MRRGQGDLWLMIVFAVLALIMLGLYITIFGGGVPKILQPVGTITEGLGFESCKLRYRAGQPDIDRDGCSDTLDKCSLLIEGPGGAKALYKRQNFVEGTTDPLSLIYLGNNYCDTDGDSVPDICDQDPKNEKIGCEMDSATGKCKPITDSVKLAKMDIANCRTQVEENMRIGTGGGLFA